MGNVYIRNCALIQGINSNHVCTVPSSLPRSCSSLSWLTKFQLWSGQTLSPTVVQPDGVRSKFGQFATTIVPNFSRNPTVPLTEFGWITLDFRFSNLLIYQILFFACQNILTNLSPYRALPTASYGPDPANYRGAWVRLFFSFFFLFPRARRCLSSSPSPQTLACAGGSNLP